MAALMLATRAHNATGGNAYGPGGPRCTCCGPAPDARKAERRRVRRVEARAWRKDQGV